MTANALKDRLVTSLALLQVPGIGRGRYRKLVEVFGTPSAVAAAALPQLTAIPGISLGIASAVKERYAECLEQSKVAAARIGQLGWQVLFLGDDAYPQNLAAVPDAPPILFALGQSLKTDENTIAIVGTRRPTEKGRRFTVGLAAELARAGVTVVSGMAEGIDSAAHIGAIEGGGRTVAVWGSSLDIIYPPGNRKLAERITEQGCLLSEYPPGTHPDRATFPDRNRIISGLSAGVVVVEAGRKSGALITAEYGLAQGRELFAVPGAPDARQSEGTNRLIRKGAKLITRPDDIFEELPRLRGQVVVTRFQENPDMTGAEKSLAQLLAGGPLQVDQIAREAQLSSPEVLELLLAMELKGFVQELSGKRYILAGTV